MTSPRLLAVLVAAVAQACVIAWSADWIYAAHSQAAAALSAEGIIVWLMGLVVFGMAWVPLLGAALLAALLAFVAVRTLGPARTADSYLYCFVPMTLFAFAGWECGVWYWPPSPPGPYDSRGTLFHVLLGLSALLYLPFSTFAVWATVSPRKANRPSTPT